MTIKKAVIPAAGLGTRMLPISRAVPKEMLPIVDRPAISYLVDEAIASGITDILIITNRDKDMIEDYFDISPEYEQKLRSSGKTDEIDAMYECATRANVYFIRQKVTKGLGHAVSCARAFVGDEPFAVLYGDDVIFSEKPVCRQLIDAYEKYGRAVCGVKEVPDELVSKYCSLKTAPIEGSDNCFFVDDMMVWGTALVNAHNLENNLALYPRIIIDPKLIGDLKLADPNCIFVKCKEWIEQDADGFFMINYLNKYLLNKEIFIIKLMGMAEDNIVKYNAEGKMKACQKWLWFSNYIKEKLITEDEQPNEK